MEVSGSSRGPVVLGKESRRPQVTGNSNSASIEGGNNRKARRNNVPDPARQGLIDSARKAADDIAASASGGKGHGRGHSLPAAIGVKGSKPGSPFPTRPSQVPDTAIPALAAELLRLNGKRADKDPVVLPAGLSKMRNLAGLLPRLRKFAGEAAAGDARELHELCDQIEREQVEAAQKETAQASWRGEPWEVTALLRQWIDDERNSNEAFAELKRLFGDGQDADTRMAQALAEVMQYANRGSHAPLRELAERVAALFVLFTGLPLCAYEDGAEPVELELDPKLPDRNPHPHAPKVEQELHAEKCERALRHQKLQREDDTFVKDMLDAFLGHPAKDDTEKLVCALLASATMPYDRLTQALDRASRHQTEAGALANRLYSELVNTEHALKKTGEPMSGCDRVFAFARVIANGVREGACHGAARFLIEWLVVMVPAARMPVLILSTAVFPLMGYAHLRGLRSSAYLAQPSKVIDALLSSAGMIAGGTGIVIATLVYLEVLPFSLFVTGVAAGTVRVLREVFQTWSDQHWTRGLDWSRQDGRPPSARDQFHVNLLRDTIYTVLSVAAAVAGPAWVQSYLDELRSIPGDAADEAWRIFISLLPATLNEVFDGISPDVSKWFEAWLKGLRILDGKRVFPGLSSQPFLKRASARLLLNTPADLFFMAAATLRKEGFRNEAYIFTVLGGLLAGMLGGMRARSANYLTTGETVAENGMVNPDGLFYVMCAGIGSCASGVGSCVGSIGKGLAALAGYAAAVPAAVPVAAHAVAGQPAAGQAAVRQAARGITVDANAGQRLRGRRGGKGEKQTIELTQVVIDPLPDVQGTGGLADKPEAPVPAGGDLTEEFYRAQQAAGRGGGKKKGAGKRFKPVAGDTGKPKGRRTQKT